MKVAQPMRVATLSRTYRSAGFDAAAVSALRKGDDAAWTADREVYHNKFKFDRDAWQEGAAWGARSIIEADRLAGCARQLTQRSRRMAIPAGRVDQAATRIGRSSTESLIGKA